MTECDIRNWIQVNNNAIDRVIQKYAYLVQSFQSCFGILRYAEKFSPEALERCYISDRSDRYRHFDVNGEYYISEVNPRFGGGYFHAFESGADRMRLIINNLKGLKTHRSLW